MRKNKLKVIITILAFILIPTTGYILEPGTVIKDVLVFSAVMVILTALETGMLTFSSAEKAIVIPQRIKTVIGVVMLLGLASVLSQSGWCSTGYFSNTIILQFPITLIDVSVLTTIGITLYWAGEITYRVITNAVIAIGNFCYYILGKTGLVELENGGEEVNHSE